MLILRGQEERTDHAAESPPVVDTDLNGIRLPVADQAGGNPIIPQPSVRIGNGFE